MISDETMIKAIRDVGGIVHSDGNIFFTNCLVLRRCILMLVLNEIEITATAESKAKP